MLNDEYKQKLDIAKVKDVDDLTTEDKLCLAVDKLHINSIDKLKPYIDLDIAALRVYIGPVNYTRKEAVSEVIDSSVCAGCTYCIQKDVAQPNMQCQSCPFNNIAHKVIYKNPKQKYKLYNRYTLLQRDNIRLSYAQLVLMLILQAWPSGYITRSGYDATLINVYMTDLEDMTGYGKDYIDQCLKRLANLGLLYLSKVGPRHYDITMPDYYRKYEKASKGGSGYTQIDITTLSNLIHSSSILELRGKLLQLILQPDVRQHGKDVVIKIEEIQNILPSYVKSKKYYEQAFKNDLFNMVHRKGDKIIFYTAEQSLCNILQKKDALLKDNLKKLSYTIRAIFLKSDNFIKNYKASEDDVNTSYIDALINDMQYNKLQDIKDKGIKDFLKDALIISLEYNYQIMIEALQNLKKLYTTYSPISNPGAILRQQCCSIKYSLNN